METEIFTCAVIFVIFFIFWLKGKKVEINEFSPIQNNDNPIKGNKNIIIEFNANEKLIKVDISEFDEIEIEESLKNDQQFFNELSSAYLNGDTEYKYHDRLGNDILFNLKNDTWVWLLVTSPDRIEKSLKDIGYK